MSRSAGLQPWLLLPLLDHELSVWQVAGDSRPGLGEVFLTGRGAPEVMGQAIGGLYGKPTGSAGPIPWQQQPPGSPRSTQWEPLQGRGVATATSGGIGVLHLAGPGQPGHALLPRLGMSRRSVAC
jgi:hypothetical protein